MGRIFNAEIMGVIMILSYMLTAHIHDAYVDIKIIIVLFVLGFLAHVWGAYHNDRMDYRIDKDAEYCQHKPLIAGTVDRWSAFLIECTLITTLFLIVFLLSETINWIITIYAIGAIGLAWAYNRYNKDSQTANIIGQMYAAFVVLLGMSMIVRFDAIVFLSAIAIGLNGVYLNIVEADIKDVDGDIVNVPKALGVYFGPDGYAQNIGKFYMLNECLKLVIGGIVISTLILLEASIWLIVLAFILYCVNWVIRGRMFIHMCSDREHMKNHIALQELTAIMFISTIYMAIHWSIPLIVVLYIFVWLVLWDKIMWGTWLRPQV